MKHLELYENFLAEKKRIYTLKEIQAIQSKGFYSSDIIFDAEPDDKFELLEVPISFVKHPITLDHYRKAGMDEDISIVENLIERYENGQYVGPIVVDENGKIMDGIHRFAAQKYLKYPKIPVFKRISKIKLEDIRVLSKKELSEGTSTPVDSHIADIAFHVFNREKISFIKSKGILPSSAKKGDLPDNIRGYKDRLFLTFDEGSRNDIAKALLEFWYDSMAEESAKVSYAVINWKKFIKENEVALYKDPMMQYYKEYQEKGFLGGFYLKTPIPTKYILDIKPLNIKLNTSWI